MEGRTERWLPLAGALAAIVEIVAFTSSGDSPNTDASTAKIAHYYATHSDDYYRLAVAGAVGGLLILLFSAALRHGLARGEGRPSTWSNVAFAGVVVYGVGLFIIGGIDLSFAEMPDAVAPTVAQAVHIIGNDQFMPIIGGSAIMLIGSGAAIIRGGALPRWLGWVALILGLASPTPAGFFAFMIGLLWTVVVAILLIVRADRGAAEEAPEPAAA